MSVFKARYNGTCAKCSKAVVPGQYVSWSRRQRGTIYHAQCIGEPVPPDAPPVTPGEPGQPDQAQPQPSPTPLSDITEQRIREIAQEEDARGMGALIAAVDERLSKSVPAVLNVKIHQPDGKVVEFKVDNAHRNLRLVAYLITKRKHAYLYGPPGSGKSTGGFMAFKALGWQFGYCSLNPQTPESRLLGFIDAGGIYRETEFFRRYTQGGGFVIDEMDNAHPALLNTLNGMLETDEQGIGRGAFPCGVVERHPDFVVVATGNTNGRGADKLFPERRALDAAFLERFTFVSWGYDEAMEKAVTLSINADAKPWLGWVRKVRKYTTEHGIRLWASPRASFNGATMLRDVGGSGFDSLAAVADAVLFKGLDADTVTRVLAACPLPVDAPAPLTE